VYATTLVKLPTYLLTCVDGGGAAPGYQNNDLAEKLLHGPAAALAVALAE